MGGSDSDGVVRYKSTLWGTSLTYKVRNFANVSLVMVVNEIVLQSKVNALETSAAVFDSVESEPDAQ